MPTLLTNPKMDPALAARIEASIQRRRGHSGRDIYRPSTVAIARALMVLAIVGMATTIFVAQRRAREKFERRRAALAGAVEAQASTLTESEKNVVARAEAAVRRLAGPYEGDFVASELRAEGALSNLLASPAAYVRGNIENITRAPSIATVAEESNKDALLFCLFDPPASRDEKVLAAKVSEAWEPKLLEQRTAQVASLRDAAVGLPLLQPSFLARVKAVRSAREFVALEHAFASAPIGRAKKVAHAQYLIAAIDEGPTFLAFSGDTAHDVRFAIVELATSKVVLRVRRHVDPANVSAARRVKYSVDIDGCTVALEARDAVGR